MKRETITAKSNAPAATRWQGTAAGSVSLRSYGGANLVPGWVPYLPGFFVITTQKERK